MSDTEKQEMQRELERLREALDWYADEQNYAQMPAGYNLVSQVERDRGTKARNALCARV